MRAAIGLVVCITTTTLVSLCWAQSRYSDFKISVFNRDDSIQTSFLQAVTEIEGIFDKNMQSTGAEIQSGLDTANAIASKIPILGSIFEDVVKVFGTLLKEKDWKAEVQDMIRKEIEQANPINDVEDMLKKFNTALQWMQFPTDVNVNDIYKDLQEMLDKFSDFASTSHQKPYPLVGSQLLIALSLAIATFEPTAAAVKPKETKYFTLPCQAYDLLRDYRSYAVDVRLRKLNTFKTSPEKITDLKLEEYKPEGYISDIIAPECKHNPMQWMVDSFSPKVTYRSFYSHCHIGYAKYLKHQIEKVFPVDRLKEECAKEWPSREPSGKVPILIELYLDRLSSLFSTKFPFLLLTGLGILTIRFIRVIAVELEDLDHLCDKWLGGDCDSYVVLSINGKEVFRTKPRKDEPINEIEQVFTSEKISKDSDIKIEILDDDEDGNYETVMKVEDKIDGLIKKPVRTAPHVRRYTDSEGWAKHEANKLETAVFWRDIYDYKECSATEPTKCTKSKLYQDSQNFGNFMGGKA